MRIEAAVSRAGEPFPRIETVEIEPPRAGEVLVRMVASGICHTDLGAHAGGVGGPGRSCSAMRAPASSRRSATGSPR